MKPETEAWRLIHSRYSQNTTEMMSGSLLHDHADKYNQLLDENIQEYKELYEQIQAYFSSTMEILDPNFKQELDRMAKDAHRETQRYVAILQSIFDFPEEKLQIFQDHDMLGGSDWEYRTANTLHVTDDHSERFHAKVKQKEDRHLNEYEGKFTGRSSRDVFCFFATRTTS